MKNVTQFFLTTLISAQAMATLTPTLERGDKNIYFNSPRNIQEVCVIPKHYPNASYKKSDLETEQKLCSYSFYKVTVAEAQLGFQSAAICPKLNSTNPGTEFHKIPENMTKEDVEINLCEGASKIGKFKNSTSCSYAPSIIGYYHVSRILGGIGRVPPSVLRSVDIETHKKVAEKAIKLTSKDPSALIYQTWTSLYTKLRQGLAHKDKDLLLSDDGQQSYGAFIKNPSQEEFYKELFTSGADRAVAFRDKNFIFQMVKDKKSIEQIVANQWEATNIQKLYAMRDATEFILLDHLLDQQDRFGNIAYQNRLVYQAKDQKTGQIILKIADDMEEYTVDKNSGIVISQFQPIQFKSMLLKDNDCGVSKENKVKIAGLLNEISHMNPKTYKKLMQLQKEMSSQAMLENGQTQEKTIAQFFTRNLMFSGFDYKEFVANVADAARIIKTNCQSGKLKLDLDIETYLTTGKINAAACE